MSWIRVHRGCGFLQPMGPCNPCKRSTKPTSKTIQVVHLDGFLEEYESPTLVKDIIGSLPKHFMTTPIELMHGLVLMKLDTLLEPDKVYFVLPYSILRFNESSQDLISLAKKLASIAKAHQSKSKPKPKPKPAILARLQEKQSSQGSNSCHNESTTNLAHLAQQFTSIVRAHRSKPKLVSEKETSHGFDPSPSEENSDMIKSTKMLSWKPLLATIREISFNRRESDL